MGSAAQVWAPAVFIGSYSTVDRKVRGRHTTFGHIVSKREELCIFFFLNFLSEQPRGISVSWPAMVSGERRQFATCAGLSTECLCIFGDEQKGLLNSFSSSRFRIWI